MYVELDKFNFDECVVNWNLMFEYIIVVVNWIMCFYVIDVKEVVWWLIYEIGYRLIDKFDDVFEGEIIICNLRVFIVGDVCYIYSFKVG